MTALVSLPIVLPIAFAILLLVARDSARWTQRLALGGSALQLAVALFLAKLAVVDGRILALPLGAWPPGVGIVWVVDALAAIMLVLAGVISLAVVAHAPASLRDGERWPFFPLQQLLMVGVNGCFLTGDLFNLFVFLEVMLVASFGAISLGARPRQMRLVMPYVIVNLVMSGIFLTAVALIYPGLGTVTMAELPGRIEAVTMTPSLAAGLALLLAVFCVKTGVAPVFFWLPDSYPEAPIPVSALFAALLTKVGVYALYRLVPLLSGFAAAETQAFLLVLALATMTGGVIGALGRNGLRSILSFHVISQVGYMVLGIALYTPLAVAAGILYTIHHVIVKAALFLVGGLVERMAGTGRLDRIGGVSATHPVLAAAFLVPALSLAGIPPLSGFWGKWLLIAASVDVAAWTAVAVSVGVSLLTLASMLKIWTKAFWGEPTPLEAPVHGAPWAGALAATFALASLSVVIGLAASPLFDLAERAAAQLMAVAPYVDAVRQAGGRP